MDDPLNACLAPSHPDPYAWYRRQGEAAPLQFDDDLGLWVLWSTALQREALAHPALKVRPPAEPVPQPLQGRPLGEWFGRLVRMNDGPDRHAVPKASLHQALARLAPEEVARRTARVAAELHAAPWSRWAKEIPVRAMADLLGFHARAQDDVVAWVDAMVAALSAAAGDADRRQGDAAVQALLAGLDALRDGARPGSIAATCRDDPGLAGAAGTANLAGLLTQTCEATAGLLGNAVVALARGAPIHALPALVDEVMRHDPPVHNTRRFAAAPVQLAGQTLPAGATVLVVIGMAGRDPAVHDAPDQFLVDREAPPALGFGWGPHACPGARLARAIVVAALATRLDGVAPAWPTRWHYRPLPNARVPVFDVDVTSPAAAAADIPPIKRSLP